MVRTFSKKDIPGGSAPWAMYRKSAITRAVKIDGPFICVGNNGEFSSCANGYLALMHDDTPYAIPTDEFEAIYEPIGS
jgi:hypothetical protein